MRNIYFSFFLLQASIYAFLYYCKYHQLVFDTFTQNYLSDFLCLPIVLSITLFLIRRINRFSEVVFSRTMVFVAWLYISLVFEWFLPSMSSNYYTADIFDVLFYGAGGVFFKEIQLPLLSFKGRGLAKS